MSAFQAQTGLVRNKTFWVEQKEILCADCWCLNNTLLHFQTSGHKHTQGESSGVRWMTADDTVCLLGSPLPSRTLSPHKHIQAGGRHGTVLDITNCGTSAVRSVCQQIWMTRGWGLVREGSVTRLRPADSRHVEKFYDRLFKKSIPQELPLTARQNQNQCRYYCVSSL